MNVKWYNEERISTILEVEMFTQKSFPDSEVIMRIEGLPSKIVEVQSQEKGVTNYQIFMPAQQNNEVTIQFLQGEGLLYLGEIKVREVTNNKVSQKKRFLMLSLIHI